MRLAEAGIEPSLGSRGHSYDNLVAETTNGLCKAELIHWLTTWKTMLAAARATLDWVELFNDHRLCEPIGYAPPVRRRGELML